jgi:TolA-binding protein
MANDDSDIMTPAELGQKLVVALRSVSDPQALMQAIADRTALNLRSELITKIDAMEKAVVLWHDDLVRVPTEVQKSVAAVREILEQVILRSKSEVHDDLSNKIEKSFGEIVKLNGKIATLSEVSEERFKSIQIQFTLLKQATEQLDLANKTAIAAALQAQKESAGETQKSSQAAIAKSETSTSEAIKALTTTFQVAISALTDRYNDLKSRLDRGEGKSSQSDPAIERMNALLIELSNKSREGAGHTAGVSQSTGLLIAVAGLVVAAGVLFLKAH